ncbi:hypothetical protein MHY87_03700 [Microvirga sp. ACRRW]|uniref:hypothetical protein n=1 Tax=Microvirga sp. ACRRW TaxID=2918205 RepID=UPI001EF705EA|nr:hypothetical protein [Microvirga sp. ACRRW]MCG7392004.1 hypothetical protein [Microvirga sp. ACRRW]
MSLPEERPPLASFIHEEMSQGISNNLSQLLDLLPSVARLRLVAFLHLVEQPDTMKATLEVQPSGLLRLTLDTTVAPCPSQRN